MSGAILRGVVAPDDPELPFALRGERYVAVYPDQSPEAGEAERARVKAHFCPNGHAPDAKPGGYCERCGLTVPPLTPEERRAARIAERVARRCPKGHLDPTTSGECPRCGTKIVEKHPLLG